VWRCTAVTSLHCTVCWRSVLAETNGSCAVMEMQRDFVDFNFLIFSLLL